MEKRIRGKLGDAVYGVDDTTLEASIIRLLDKKRETLAVAESITGGGVGERLTGVPGSSGVFLGGFITYTPEIKAALAARIK